jgi:hypothetical protein
VDAPVGVDDLAVLRLELHELPCVLRLELFGGELVLDRLAPLVVRVYEIGEVDVPGDACRRG